MPRSTTLSAILVALASCVGATPARPVVASTRAPPPRSFDRDGDGIPDARDRCPDAPEDCDGYEDDDGCPDDDNDGDRIPDVCDRCPDSPEIYGRADLVLDGCHDDPPRMIEGAEPASGPPTPPPERPFREDGLCHDGTTPGRPVAGGCPSRLRP